MKQAIEIRRYSVPGPKQESWLARVRARLFGRSRPECLIPLDQRSDHLLRDIGLGEDRRTNHLLRDRHFMRR